jgi:hypothetical protein
LICKGTLRQVFIRVYRLEIHSVMLVFLTKLWHLVHSFYLLSDSYSAGVYHSVSDQIQNLQNLYTQTDKDLLESPFAGQFF